MYNTENKEGMKAPDSNRLVAISFIFKLFTRLLSFNLCLLCPLAHNRCFKSTTWSCK